MTSRVPMRAVAVLALVLWTGTARADLRVWSEGTRDDAGAEEGETARYLDLTGFIQPGYVWRQEDDGAAARTDIPTTDDQLFVRNARVGIRALAYPWLAFRVQLETTAPVGLRDASVDLIVDDAFQLRAGQLKVPFAQAFLFRDSLLAFVDRPLYVPSEPDRGFLAFLPGRDIGLMAHGVVGDTENGPALEYGAGVFAGGGPNQVRDTDGTVMLAARVEAHLFGVPEADDAENDVARSYAPELAVGVGGFVNCSEGRQWNRGFTMDTELRLHGVYASAGFVWIKSGPRNGDFLAGPVNYGAEDACGRPVDVGRGVFLLPTHISIGTHVQAQYALPPLLFPVEGQSLELLARWDLARPSAPPEGLVGGDESSDGYGPPHNYVSPYEAPDQWRLTFGVNWYPTDDPSLRLSIDYQLRRETEDVVVGVVDSTRISEIDNDSVWLELTAGL